MASRDSAAAPLRRGRLRDRHPRRHDRDVAARARRPPADRVRADRPDGGPRQPGRCRSSSGRRSPDRSSAGRRRRPVLNLVLLLVRRGRIEQLPRVAAEFRRLDNAPPGHHPRHRHQRRAADRAEVRALTARLEQMTGGRDRARDRGRPEPARRARRAGRRPPDRRERPGPPRAAAEPARLGRPLGDPVRWPFVPTRSPASSSPRSTRSTRAPRRAASARSSRSATASPRSTGSMAPSPPSCSSSRAASWAWP